MKPNKASISNRPVKSSVKTVSSKRTYKTLLFARVCNGHCIRLRHWIDTRLFSLERLDPWPTKAVTTLIKPKSSGCVPNIHQKAAPAKPLATQETFNTKHMIQTKGN